VPQNVSCYSNNICCAVKHPLYLFFFALLSRHSTEDQISLTISILEHPVLAFLSGCDSQSFILIQRTGKITVIFILNFVILEAKCTTKYSARNDSKQSLPSVDSYILREWNFVLLELFPNIWNVLRFQSVYYLILWCDLFCPAFCSPYINTRIVLAFLVNGNY
jgi:hypothetical protein